ncbi:hypothetical protein [Chitinophaga filiformis]|uniref:TerB family tellurite resistance protein n=1 Tax=Chitinophaga filiformis TaxID=104663 RepID=A0ABY4HW67_CHIFI|nr:hypothetical protein [Chitinophaga filiformis]UPK68028.1 hypothetical protein MYF79_24040 [Chitinophaga filiformis]
MKMCCCICLCLLTVIASAQTPTFKEWFKQKKTQKEYLLTQIAELKIYLELLQKGYKAANQGIAFIHQIKNGEFGLHDLFYKSLQLVSPALTAHADVGALAASQLLLVTKAQALRHAAQQNNMLAPAAKATVVTGCGRLSTDALALIDQLNAAFSAHTFSMSDDHRLQILEELRQRSREQWAFFQSCRAQAAWLGQQRQGERIEDQVIKNYYGIQ